MMCDSCVYITDISDHLPVIISLKTHNTNTHQPKYKYIRDTTEANYRRYLERIAELTSSIHFDLSLNTNPNIAHNKLHHILKTSASECFPMKKVKNTKYNTKHSPWITQALMKSVKTKDSMYNQLRWTNSNRPSYTIKEGKLKKYRSILNNLIRKTKREYYKAQFKKFSQDCKNTWKLLNEVAGRKAKKMKYQATSKNPYRDQMTKNQLKSNYMTIKP